MPDDRKVVKQCSLCGKDLKEGDSYFILMALNICVDCMEKRRRVALSHAKK